ncbi:MAG: hypothetical protein IPJ60_12845 [Sphingobacteriaceae bacterium]|nr:hypothetical protein [Sphingobacteriaceae bacterium]
MDNHFTEIIPKNTVLKHYWLLNKKNGKYNFAFIGPSRVLNTLDMSVFERNLKVNPINLGLSGAGYAEQYLMFKTFIDENKNRINRLFIEISYFNVIDPDSSFSYPFHEYYYFPYIKKEFVYNIIKDNSKNKLKAMAWRYIPLIRYAEFNVNFRPLILFTSTIEGKGGDSGFNKHGDMLVDKAMDANYEKGIYSNAEMNTKTINYLEEMVAFKRNKMEIILFTSPTYDQGLSASKEALLNYRKVVSDITNKYGIKYYNFETADMCSDKNYFADRTQLNRRGAEVFSKVFCDSLISSDNLSGQ